MRKLSKDLIRKSQDSFILALELYNKPTINYRAESFSILFINSWELLLKAKIFEDSSGRKLSIFRRKLPKQKRQSLTLDECIVKVFLNNNDPVKKNLEFIAEIRNEASHLIISEFNAYYSRAFQSGAINYIRKLNEWFKIQPDTYLPTGFLGLITDENFPDMEKIKGQHNKEDFANLLDWVKKYEDLQKLGNEGALSVQHTIAIVKNAKKADFVISAGAGNNSLAIIERVRDVDQTHPHRMIDVINRVNNSVDASKKITSYDLQAYVFVRGLKKANNDYFWQTKYASGQYSDKLVQELCEAIQNNPNDKNSWRSQYLQHMRSKRARA